MSKKHGETSRSRRSRERYGGYHRIAGEAKGGWTGQTYLRHFNCARGSRLRPSTNNLTHRTQRAGSRKAIFYISLYLSCVCESGRSSRGVFSLTGKRGGELCCSRGLPSAHRLRGRGGEGRTATFAANWNLHNLRLTRKRNSNSSSNSNNNNNNNNGGTRRRPLALTAALLQRTLGRMEKPKVCKISRNILQCPSTCV